MFSRVTFLKVYKDEIGTKFVQQHLSKTTNFTLHKYLKIARSVNTKTLEVF